ncbi:anti-sigma factor [Actinokineospora guangxiensis]|uniref:Anti-sigma factor n=1 Tax=Actinokineospora guangxiensis TaxID=1490288 RepID=A0ABW0EV69_9PSEU
MRHCDEARLIALAAEDATPEPAEAEHLAECARCRADLAVVRIARDGLARGERLEVPPERVWSAIAADIAADIADDPAAESDHSADERAPQVGRWRRLVPLAVAAAVGALVGAAVTAALSWSPRPPDAQAIAAARLAGPAATGSVRVVSQDDRRFLHVKAEGLAPGSGYFEVWLLDAEGKRMYALGVLTPGVDTRLAIPAGLPLEEFAVVDVSLQAFNGDPAHSKNSVLRGTLTL